MSRTFVWRAAYGLPYGEGVVLVNAATLEAARETAIADARTWIDREAGGEAERSIRDCEPDITLEPGAVGFLEFSE